MPKALTSRSRNLLYTGLITDLSSKEKGLFNNRQVWFGVFLEGVNLNKKVYLCQSIKKRAVIKEIMKIRYLELYFIALVLLFDYKEKNNSWPVISMTGFFLYSMNNSTFVQDIG